MTRIISLMVSLATCFAVSVATTAKTYQTLSPTAYTALRNPARGLIYQQDIYLSDPATFATASDLAYDLNPAATPNMTVVQLMIYLDTATSGSPLTTNNLTSLNTQVSAVRSIGAKAVLRFAYTSSTSSATTEPPLADILQHITQLTPLLQNATDVLLNVQQGFIGVWGEGYYTTNFGNEGIINATAQAARNAVTSALLAAIPWPIQLQVRTPAFEQAYLNSTAAPVDAATAFGATPGARLGQFDDCFLASSDDEGTYRESALNGPDHTYVAQASRYTVRGGETCTPSKASLYACPRALEILEQEHWTWLHVWNQQYVSAWKKQGCWDEIRARLGYWLTLEGGTWKNGSSEDEGSVGWQGMSVKNLGFATPMLEYGVEVLFVPNELLGAASSARAASAGSKQAKKGKKGKTGGKVGSFSVVVNGNHTGFAATLAANTFDVRNWTASGDGGNTTLPDITFCLDPSTVVKTNTTYELFWNIFDVGSANPAHRILLGNVGITSGPSWVVNSRVNRLGLSVTGAGLNSSAEGAGCDVVLSQKSFSVNEQGVLVW